jgi:hypothetical protein
MGFEGPTEDALGDTARVFGPAPKAVLRNIAILVGFAVAVPLVAAGFCGLTMLLALRSMLVLAERER